VLSVGCARPGRTGKGDAGSPSLPTRHDHAEGDIPDSKRLHVAPSPIRHRTGPATRCASSSTARRQPISRSKAEVALAAADEGVLSHRRLQTPDPMAVFYAPWGLGVKTSTSYERFAHRVEPGRR